MKVDAQGKQVWRKNFDCGGSEWGNSLTLLPDGNYGIAARSRSPEKAFTDGWLLKVNASRELLDEHLIEGPFVEDAADLILNTPDGEIVVIGPGAQYTTPPEMYGWIIRYKGW